MLKREDHTSLPAYLTASGLTIPHFCYHSNLSISGNCKMCLIELHKSAKPVTCCTADGQLLDDKQKVNIYHDSVLIKKARENILEFLLLNHPIDCPVCDQGGDCDLQDLAAFHGFISRRFHNYKRAVNNKKIGPIVKTLMTRCIHCTRCIRFAKEIVGIQELGLLGRGKSNEIGTYLNKKDLIFKKKLYKNDFHHFYFNLILWTSTKKTLITKFFLQQCVVVVWKLFLILFFAALVIAINDTFGEKFSYPCIKVIIENIDFVPSYFYDYADRLFSFLYDFLKNKISEMINSNKSAGDTFEKQLNQNLIYNEKTLASENIIDPQSNVNSEDGNEQSKKPPVDTLAAVLMSCVVFYAICLAIEIFLRDTKSVGGGVNVRRVTFNDEVEIRYF